jgi:HD superfamily phosphohydrolase
MRTTVIDDPVFGRHHISQPLLQGLLGADAVVRLNGVHQAGASYLVRPRRDLARHAHAVGVMLLVRLLGGSLDEQAAGLLHDVSHTAFSHVADQVFANRAEDHHEQGLAAVVRRSEIPAIFQRYLADLDVVLDLDRWSLLDQPLPELCADRIDYTLRDLLHVGWISKRDIDWFLASLTVHEGRIVTTSLEAATWFTHQYHREVTELFMDPRELYANARLAQAIRCGLDSAIVEPADLLLEDDELLKRLTAAGDQEIAALLDQLTPGLAVVEDPATFDVQAFSKARFVDPLVLDEHQQPIRCSTLDPSVGALHEQVGARAARGIFLRAV